MTKWRGRLQFLQPGWENFNIRSKGITQCTKTIKNYSIFQKQKLLNCFHGHKESIFHKFAGIVSTKGRKTEKISLTVPKWKIKYYFYKRKKFLKKKHSYGHVESSFCNLADRFWTKRQNIQLKVWKKYQTYFFQKNIFRK